MNIKERIMNLLNHKTTIVFLLLAGISCWVPPVFSGQIGYTDKAYQDGDTLSATDMNDTFNEIKTDVNDNDTRITTITDDYLQKPILTQLHYSGSDSVSPITGNYELIRTVSTFTKVNSDSIIELNWNGHGRVDGTAGEFCEFQLRIDGMNNLGGAGTGYDLNASGSTVLYTVYSPISVKVWFSGLTAADHTVSIWVRGVATTGCSLNNGNFSQDVYVTEIPIGPNTIQSLSVPFQSLSLDTETGGVTLQ